MRYIKSYHKCMYCNDKRFGIFARLRITLHIMYNHGDMYINGKWV